MAEMLIIGIAGGSGSGKSTIARLLSEHFGGRVAVIRHDDYYRAQHDMPFEERRSRTTTTRMPSTPTSCSSISRRSAAARRLPARSMITWNMTALRRRA